MLVSAVSSQNAKKPIEYTPKWQLLSSIVQLVKSAGSKKAKKITVAAIAVKDEGHNTEIRPRVVSLARFVLI